MKKIVSLLLVCILMVGVLASCGNASLAKKINKAAEGDDPMTYEEVKDALKGTVIDGTMNLNGSRNGTLSVIKGVKDQEDMIEAAKKIQDGKSVKGIIVLIVDGNAVAAIEGKLDKDSEKKLQDMLTD